MTIYAGNIYIFEDNAKINHSNCAHVHVLNIEQIIIVFEKPPALMYTRVAI